MTTTIAHILKVWEQTKPKPVYVFCHRDDHERVTEALTLMPCVQVLVSPVVPAGQLYVAKDVPFTEDEIRHRLDNQGD